MSMTRSRWAIGPAAFAVGPSFIQPTTHPAMHPRTIIRGLSTWTRKLFLIFSLFNLTFTKAQWTDQSLVSTVVKYGPNLADQGDTFNLDGTVISKTSISYTAKSVITGFDSYFPETLPSSLKVPFLTPDSTHPDLAFWYTPDVFTRDGIADGTRVSEWINVANICYNGHPSTSCTLPKKSNKQVVYYFDVF